MPLGAVQTRRVCGYTVRKVLPPLLLPQLLSSVPDSVLPGAVLLLPGAGAEE